MVNDVDIVIIGGGMIGATMALALARSCPSLSIGIVEPVASDSKQQPSYDDRSIAIANASATLLEKYGVWETLASHATNIQEIQVSDRGHIGKTYINASHYQVPALGHVLEVTHLGRELRNTLKSCANVSWFCPDSVTTFSNHVDYIDCELSSGKRLRCALVLACDGGRSATREAFNLNTYTAPYNQTALIANISVSEGFENRAFERFTEFGPMALLPLPEQRYSLVWCHSDVEIKKLLKLSQPEFLSELQSAFGYRAGVFTQVSQRDSYPLYLVQAQRLIQHRMALIGNAGHSIHPIAGQGYNLGIRDVEVMSRIISSLAEGEDIGSHPVLSQYAQQRAPDIQHVISLTDSLVRIFSQSSKLMAFGRSLGLATTQLLPPIKQKIATQAMGWNGINNST